MGAKHEAARDLIKANNVHRTKEDAGQDTTGSARHLRGAAKAYDRAKKK